MARVTEQILFSGRVQGVGFRWTAERRVGDLALTGYVKNLADGRVELVVTGEPAAISRLIERLNDYFGEGITGMERNLRAELEEFSGFSIRR